MRRIGLIGGMSWESTAHYYRLLNERVAQRLGGLHSARVLLASVDFAVIEDHQRAGDWDGAGELLAAEARALEAGGAELVLLCTNTMHRCYDAVAAATRLPVPHLADVTAQAAQALGVQRVGLLATRYTMEQDFYVGRLRAQGLTVLVPAEPERAELQRVIFDELCLGEFADSSRTRLAGIAADLVAAGAQAIVLGCTELELLLGPDDIGVPLLATTSLHVDAALRMALPDWPRSAQSVAGTPQFG